MFAAAHNYLSLISRWVESPRFTLSGTRRGLRNLHLLKLARFMRGPSKPPVDFGRSWLNSWTPEHPIKNLITKKPATS